MDHVQWVIQILKEKGFEIKSPLPTIIQDTPWATVSRFETHCGFVFLKKVPPKLFLESNVIKMLYERFHANVPQIIGSNQEENCFLMHDAGIQLHEYFKLEFQKEILIKAMNDYNNVQIKSYDAINSLLELGIPDWRLHQLPKLYNKLIAEKDILIDDGITQEELIKLKRLEHRLISICEELSQFNIKDTLGHADFHDKNILINVDTKKITLIDLGEVVIAHPFFSFLNCLFRASENFNLSGRQYCDLENECFEPWLVFETSENLIKILSLIRQCWPVHSVLGEFRLINSVNISDFHTLRREGRLAKNLRHWINANS